MNNYLKKYVPVQYLHADFPKKMFFCLFIVSQLCIYPWNNLPEPAKACTGKGYSNIHFTVILNHPKFDHTFSCFLNHSEFFSRGFQDNQSFLYHTMPLVSFKIYGIIQAFEWTSFFKLLRFTVLYCTVQGFLNIPRYSLFSECFRVVKKYLGIQG